MAYGLCSTPSPARVHGDTTLLVSGRASRAHASAPDDVGVGRGEEAREDVLGHRRVVLEVRRDPAGHRDEVELGEVLDRLGPRLHGVDLAHAPAQQGDAVGSAGRRGVEAEEDVLLDEVALVEDRERARRRGRSG